MYLIFCDSLFKMSKIEIKKIVEPIETSDGAGVKLKRSIGTPTVNYLDPFLLLDEFGSENKDDYMAGPFFCLSKSFLFRSLAPPPCILVKTSFLNPFIVSLAIIFPPMAAWIGI